MFAIFKKEVRSYFYSPVAYVLIGLFMLFASIMFYFMNLAGQSGQFTGGLETLKFLFILIIPILTMRILAEDRKNGTEVLLVTSPVNITGIVLGKYLAAYFIFLVMTVSTFIYPIIIVAFGGQITVQLVGAYIGFILLGAALVAVGVFTSSLSENQVVSAVVSLISLLLLMILGNAGEAIGGIISKVLTAISLFTRYDDFAAGVLNIGPIVYYLTFTAVFLFLTVRVIEKRRWSQG